MCVAAFAAGAAWEQYGIPKSRNQGARRTSRFRTGRAPSLFFAVEFVLLSIAVLPFAVDKATANEPGCDTNCTFLVGETYYPEAPTSADIWRGTVKVWRLSGESSSANDWYGMSNTLRQWQTSGLYDYMNFWNTFGELPHDGVAECPDQIEEKPGNLDTTNNEITFNLGVTGQGATATVSWLQSQGGTWEIRNGISGCRSTTNDWELYKHAEWFNLWGDRARDWDDLSVATAYQVNQEDGHGVLVKGSLKYHPNSLCWYGCADWYTSPTVYIGLPDSGDDCIQTDVQCEAGSLPDVVPLYVITDQCADDEGLGALCL